jgi:putative transposase
VAHVRLVGRQPAEVGGENADGEAVVVGLGAVFARLEGDVTLTRRSTFRSYGVDMTNSSVSYKRHRFPPEIIAHVVWLYFRFPLSLRLVEEMLLERGIIVSYETVRRWAIKFGPDFARCLKRKAAQKGDVWHLDEVVIDIGGEKRWPSS